MGRDLRSSGGGESWGGTNLFKDGEEVSHFTLAQLR